MTDNLIFLLNKLSYQIVSDVVEDNRNCPDANFRKCVEKIRQKGCDVLLGKSPGSPLPDPCVTDYGGNWSPLALLSDYAKELECKAGLKYNEILVNSMKCLQEGNYDCVNDLLKFLLILKKPTCDSNAQGNMTSRCGSNFLLVDSISTLLDEPQTLLSDALSSHSSTMSKSLKYEDSWARALDSKFQILSDYSKKNILSPDKLSFDSLFSAKSQFNSQSTFVFSDFFLSKSYQSEKNLFDKKSSCLSDVPLLDSFVENPINHKLPSEKDMVRSANTITLNDNSKRTLHLLKEEDHQGGAILESDNASTLPGINVIPKESGIELRRSSNCAHSFAILYEKNSQSDNPSVTSTDSLLLVRDRRKNRKERKSSRSSYSSSKEIILGLWEHDKALIREFRPELAGTLPSLRMITMTEFVEDVKYLLTGINSSTFSYRVENNCFNMQYGTCLADVTPESLYHFSREFIETGNYYRKLSTYATEIGKGNYETCTTISQAFWKSIFDYLELHYSLVLEIPNTTNLMMLKTLVKDIHDMIVTMSNVCRVADTGAELPEGGELLTYLLRTVERLNRPCVRNIVIGILQNCCHVYLKCILQPWMFKGHIDKQNNEFFIECNKQRLNTKSRSYYNSFNLIKERVPSFLDGLEDSIFNCGKSIHFLKLFNAGDEFCKLLETLNYPEMVLCLTDAQLDAMEQTFHDYRGKVVEKCGESISIKKIREDEEEKKREYYRFVRETKSRQEEERERAKLAELEDAKAKKDKQNKRLNEEMNKIREDQRARKRDEEEEARRTDERIAAAEARERDLVEREKKEILTFYNGVMNNLDAQMSVTECRKAALRGLLKGGLSETEDSPTGTDTGRETDDTTDLNANPLSSAREINSNTETADSNGNSGNDENSNLMTFYSTTSYLPLADDEGGDDDDGKTNKRNMQTDDNDDLKNANNIITANNFNNNNNNNNGTTNDNDNNNKSGDKNKNDDVWRSHSHRNVAAEEARRNKLKVLRSEFEIGRINEVESVKSDADGSVTTTTTTTTTTGECCTPDTSPPTNLKTSVATECDTLTHPIKSTAKASEYTILSCASEVIPMKPVTSLMEIVRNDSKAVRFFTRGLDGCCDGGRRSRSTDRYALTDPLNFQEFGLERKTECTSLDVSIRENDSDGNSVTKTTNSGDSLSSFLTPPDASEENVSALSLRSGSGTNVILNPRYRKALIKVTEISNHELAYEDVFEDLKQIQFQKHSCGDLMKFQRYLRKSIVIPLSIQEELANDALLKHILLGENLLGHLKLLRGYFFLTDGEFSRSFIHNAFKSLGKCRESREFFERGNLSNILNEALNSTVHGSEPNSQNLSFQIVKMPPFLNHASHDVLSPFELSYRVDWPLNIILTEKALDEYKTVLRFLLKLKRIVWTLNETSLFLNLCLKNEKVNAPVLASSPHYHRIQIYRHAMTQIMITLNDYIFSHGIEFPWINFMRDLETTQNIDHLYQKHVKYIKDVLTRCFLSKNSKDLLNCLYNVMELSLKFHYTAISSDLSLVDDKYEHSKFQVLRSTFNEFCSITKTFLRKLKEKIAKNEVIRSHYVLIEMFDLKLT